MGAFFGLDSVCFNVSVRACHFCPLRVCWVVVFDFSKLLELDFFGFTKPHFDGIIFWGYQQNVWKERVVLRVFSEGELCLVEYFVVSGCRRKGSCKVL